MAEYKVGKWYPHTMLKECPVHPKTRVEVCWLGWVDKDVATDFDWHESAERFEWEDVAAFKVVEEYQEPLVLWVNVFPPPSGLFVHHSKSSAEAGRGDRCIRTVKMMEVKE